MADLLLEIGCEEIPAGFVQQALVDLRKLLEAELARARLSHGAVETFGTPRRIAARVEGIAQRQPDQTREVLGPPVKAAFDAAGAPTKAALGFAKTNGVEPSALLRITTARGEYVGVRVHESGKSALDVLRTALPEVCAAIPFQKSMRWGSLSARFARPVHWIVALLGSEVVPFELAGVQSGRATRGHRFHAPEPFELADASEYFGKLAGVDVVVRPEDRRSAIVSELRRVGRELGGTPVYDEALLDEVAFLVEKPFAIAVEFPRKYLEVPKQVLLTVMRKQQRYFAFEQASTTSEAAGSSPARPGHDGTHGELVNHFAFIAGTRVRDPAVVARGALKVTRARFDDALFYLREDRKKPLRERTEALSGIVFLRGLGTLRQKVERLERLAARVATLGLGLDAKRAFHVTELEEAARLCKADLTTGIVREFPELQGYVGRHYALLEGVAPAVADAILEHYRPRGASDGPPEGVLGAVLSLADKLDSLAGCFRIGQEPTGTADPLALRRQTIGIVSTLLTHRYHLPLRGALEDALAGYEGIVKQPAGPALERLLAFFEGRLRSLWSADHAGDAVDAVLAAGFDDLLDAKARLGAIAAFQRREGYEAVATTFKRVARILKDKVEGPIEPARFEMHEERALAAATAEVGERVRQRMHERDFPAALEELVALATPVDTFFTKVFVMHEDAAIRRNRLALLRDVGLLSKGLLDFGKLAAGVEGDRN